MRKKVAIFCGGPSSEFEVSLNSARTIFQNLDKNKYEAYYFLISKTLACEIIKATNSVKLEKENPELTIFGSIEKVKKLKMFALLAGCHGEFVEDGKLQALLEIYDVAYSGSNFSSSSLAMDKYRSGLLAKESGFSIPKSIFFESENLQILKAFKFPLVVKPNNLGSSVGVAKVKNKKEFDQAIVEIQGKYETDIIIQEYIEGLELSCGVLQKRTGEFILLPPIEIRPKKSDFFDYFSKYETEGSLEITPPVSINSFLSGKISEAALKIHKILGCKTYSRSDFIVRKNKIYYLETNTLPGMTKTSLLPQEVSVIGISFSQLLDFIIENSF